MSEAEALLRQKRKRKNNQYPTIDLRGMDMEEHEQKPDDSREHSYNNREVTMLIRDQRRQAVDHYRTQQDFLRAEMDKYHENMSTRRIASQGLKMKGDLSNLIRAALADETITKAQGKETERKHRKIAFIYHSDQETTTEVTIERGGNGQ